MIDNLLSNILATDNKEINQEYLDEIILKIKQILSGYDKEKELIMLDKINKFVKLISSDRIDIKKALEALNKEDKMGGMMKMINEIERKGIEKGMEKGMEKAKIETAIEMLKDGAEIVFVQKYTKLPTEKVKELKENIQKETDA